MGSSNYHADSCADDYFMRRALELARAGQGLVEPNPMVGCVLVHDGEIIGEGYHRAFGGPHAEIEALRSLDGRSAKGATAYVSLEPCCHQGKTPPCTEALIAAQIRRVVVALNDPYPRVDGGGVKRLREAGIEVATGVLEKEANNLCAPYLKRIQIGRPWVIAKWAMTIDGKIATRNGESQWITNETSRQDVHQLRSRVDAVAVGMGTVVADDPMLNARLPDPTSSPKRIASRVVFCRNRLPEANSRLVASAGQIPLLLVAAPTVDAARLDQLQSLGAHVIHCESCDTTAMVHHALDQMGREGMTNLMLEGGSALLASFFDAGELDECHIYIGPRLFGGTAAPGPIGGSGIAALQTSPQFELASVDRFDDDLKLAYRRRRG
jgi:diaminohydroxyphosphoribosylaminopyrimidine deaminase/5-amino-6-(5-phosphoribosylamino)uracil reductase